jgi:predicted LPLAT superfamily acyltransferase
MVSWEGKTRGGITGYKIFVLTIRYLGLPFAYFLLRFVVLYFLFASRNAAASMRYYFRRILGQSHGRSWLSLCRNYYVFGQVILDKLAMLAGFDYRFTFDFEGEEHLRQMDRGGLLISAHVGNWEIAGSLLNRLNKRIHILLFDAEHQRMKGFLEETLTRRNVHFIVIRDDYSHLKEISRAFACGDIIAMHGDRFLQGNVTLPVTFMGFPARFPVGPVNIASRFSVPVSYVFAVKESRSHYHFYATPLQRIEFSRNLVRRQEILKDAVEAFAAQLEKVLKKYPLQWFNYYDFWEKDPVIQT